jgi:hypothetical protein
VYFIELEQDLEVDAEQEVAAEQVGCDQDPLLEVLELLVPSGRYVSNRAKDDIAMLQGAQFQFRFSY